MLKIIYFFSIVVILLNGSGCATVPKQTPSAPSGQEGIYQATPGVIPFKPFPKEAIEKLVGLKFPSAHWHYITIHHSATLKGNAEVFDQQHRNSRIGGLFYHFVIGNGTLSGDGEVEVGWRWRKQLEVNRPFDIQICLVGDFTRQDVSWAQFDSLVKLINILRKQYNISLSNIRAHTDISDKFTECPGGRFPFYRLLSELRKSKP